MAKQSGKIKASVTECAEGLGLDFYKLSKIHSTRFIRHRRCGLKALLETWPAYILAYENVVAEIKGYNANTRSKVSGLLKKFKSYEFMCSVQVYFDLLEATVPTSLIFESDFLLPFEVPLAISRTVLDLQQRLEEVGSEMEFLDSYLHRYNVSEDGKFSGEFIKAGDKRKRDKNRQYVTINVSLNPFSAEKCKEKVWNIKRKVIPSLIQLLEARFADFNSEIYAKMRWFDPQFWADEADYGNEELLEVAEHFQQPLAFASFDKAKVLR